MQIKKPQCLKCIHYFSTYNPASPRGCKVYGFKSSRFPSLLVKEQTGTDCQAYETRVKEEEKKDSLNDPKYW